MTLAEIQQDRNIFVQDFRFLFSGLFLQRSAIHYFGYYNYADIQDFNSFLCCFFDFQKCQHQPSSHTPHPHPLTHPGFYISPPFYSIFINSASLHTILTSCHMGLIHFIRILHSILLTIIFKIYYCLLIIHFAFLMNFTSFCWIC